MAGQYRDPAPLTRVTGDAGAGAYPEPRAVYERHGNCAVMHPLARHTRNGERHITARENLRMHSQTEKARLGGLRVAHGLRCRETYARSTGQK